ncbi:HD domain-containing protein [Kiritimatiellaeota bacterium B1221]|nr:HD domain-containing protein [Kiritimatiellaeota bacterium B1221]
MDLLYIRGQGNELMEDLPAFALAAHWHKGQTRKGRQKEPFVQHPIRVAEILIRHGITQTELISAALLHDVLEDTDCPPSEIRTRFGSEVSGWVQEVTDRKTLLKSQRKQMQVERAALLSPGAKLIRLADKIDNVESLFNDPPANWSWQRQREYAAWANRVVKNLGPVHSAMEARYHEASDQLRMKVTGKKPF